MWDVFALSLIALLVIYVTLWILKWMNPKCNGVLPPGSMGLPLIGETVNLIIPSYSLDLHPFLKKRIQRYGPIFRTSLVGTPIVISVDPEFNNYIFQQEGRLVELWYLDRFSKVFGLGGDSRGNEIGVVHKYARGTLLNRFGADSLKAKLLPQIEEFINKTLCSWSSQESVEVKHAGSVMFLNFSAKQMIGYEIENSTDSLSGNTLESQKAQKEVTNMLRDILKERRTSPKTRREDLLDQINIDMDKEKFLSDDFAVQLIFVVLFAFFESISVVLALAFSLLAQHPAVLQELTAEHEAILKNRENASSLLTWDEYRSMTFTLQVINETLRLANLAPGLSRRALKDIPVNGFTIPAGWTIALVTSALHLSPNTFEDPLEFNPWRWKDLDSLVLSKNFMPFGRGLRQCVGAEYSRVFLATFLHVLVTKYEWTKIKGGRIARKPILGFGDGIHIKFCEKKD